MKKQELVLVIISFLISACGPVEPQTETPVPSNTTITYLENTPIPEKTNIASITSLAPTEESAVLLFINSGQEFGSERTFSLALGDLDNDGDLDVLVANFLSASKIWFNNGGDQGGILGVFSSGQEIGTRTGHGTALGDLDGDGDLDAFLVHNLNPDQVWLNDGSGNLVDSGQQLGETNAASTSVSLGDVDNDGDLDAFTTHYQKPVKLWLNDGSGQFTESEANLGVDAMSVALGDVDQDGDLDALVAYDGYPAQLWLNEGDGNFTDSGQEIGRGAGWGNAVLGDIDNDGDLDAIIASNLGGAIWLNAGGKQVGSTGVFMDSGQVLGNSHYVTLADVNGDGQLDIFTCSEVRLNLGAGLFSQVHMGFEDSGCSGIWLGDVDNDGDLDVFIGKHQGITELWLNTTHP